MIHAKYYSTIFLYTVVIITIIYCMNLYDSSYRRIIRGKQNIVFASVLAISLAVFLGMRPISGAYFADTSNYAEFYRMYARGLWQADYEGEFIFNNLMQSCSQIMDVSSFFTIIDLLYFGFTLISSYRLFPNNPLAGLLFNLGSFSFYSYGVNGIRNGLACSIVLLFLTFINGKRNDRIFAAILAFIALGIHKSTILPIGVAYISFYFIKSFKAAYCFWILSIFISFVAGSTVTAFFGGLGFDDRLSYLQSEMKAGVFSRTGFRWDFLLYSMMPIILGYYIVIKKGIRDTTYEFLLNTYTLSNAFWIMVIRANFSNRFAYLSWFMYPIVLAYPLLKLNVWDGKQGKYLAQIMFAQVFFTWFMHTIY